MATSSLEESILEALTEKVTCPMCGGPYSSPRVLPCLHYYCRTCLEDRVQEHRVVTCPKCGQDHELSSEHIEKLPRGELTRETKALHSIMSRRASMDGTPTCELCTSPSGSTACAYCHHCAKYLCSFCDEVHRRLRAYTDHAVLNLDVLESKQGFRKHRSASTTVRIVCSDHDKEIEAYCFDCNKTICEDCVGTEHRGHRNESLKKASKTILRELESVRERLNSDEDELASRRARLEQAICEVERSGEDTVSFVNQSFDIVLRQFEKYRANLLQSVRNETEREARGMRAKARCLEAKQSRLERVGRLIRQHSEEKIPEEIIGNHKIILRQASETSAQLSTCTGVRELDECPTSKGRSFDVYKTSCARIIGAIGDSLKTADPIMCSLEGEGARRALLGRKTSFTVHACQSNDTPCTALQHVQVELSSVHECLECDTLTETVSGNTYRVTYTPKTQGQHILKVRVNGRAICGNPFQLLVKRPLLEAREPVRIIRGVRKLHDLALHRGGHLLATQAESGKLVSVDRRGRSLKVMLSGLGRPQGVATDSHGWVFLSRHDKCCMEKYVGGSRSGGRGGGGLEKMDSIGCKDTSLGNFNRPGRMALNRKGEIYVCDVKNSRVEVFDDDLEYLRWYSVSKPAGIALDSDGDAFVTESGRDTLCRIYVTSKKGTAVVRAGLQDPQGVYVDEEYIYVAERGAGRVSVLDREGELVTTLGVGVLAQPGAIVGDQDGYIYVCDEKLEAICVF